MARDGSKTGGKNFKKGVSGNPCGIRSGTMTAANDFKDWCFELFSNNKKDFKKAILSNEDRKLKFINMLAGFVPQKQEISGVDGDPISIKVIKNYGTYTITDTKTDNIC